MSQSIATVIPCYRVKQHILDVIHSIGPEVSYIYVVDDKCPDKTGLFVQENCDDTRVRVIFNKTNKGVGGATIAGYREALKTQATVIVKMDGDNQMDARLVPFLVRPILNGNADYTKGNRFFNIRYLERMPKIRLIGNSILSLINKCVSGYWQLMDPTNGFTAIHRKVASLLPLDKIDTRYFFESDMLFRLSTYRARVVDVPMEAIYNNEISSLNIKKVIFSFPMKHLSRFFKRIFYNYFLRDFNAGTIELLFGLGFSITGLTYGIIHLIQAHITQKATPVGIVMLATLLILMGFQLLLSALKSDIQNVPQEALHPFLDENDHC